LMTALGVALVVMVILILLGFVEGLRRTVLLTGAGGNWIVLARGVTNEPGSFITREQFEVIKSRTEIAADGEGAALISPEAVTGFMAGNLDDPRAHHQYTFLRGVYPIAYHVHRGMRIVSGRWPQRSTSEM